VVKIRTRFAPSPTGYLHVGHAYAAMQVMRFVRDNGAAMTLRIEDTDPGRCRPEFTAAILEDLHWIRCQWDDLVVQSERLSHYADALARLEQMGLGYRCFCSRKDIARATTENGPEGPIYPGTCRNIAPDDAAAKATRQPYSWRLDCRKAVTILKDKGQWPLIWTNMSGENFVANPTILGDFLLAGRDRPASYHLAVVVDDARPDDGQRAMTHIVRGGDLLHATHAHRLLQALLEYPAPVYHHHPLLVTPDGRKLSKSDQSLTLRSLREQRDDGAALLADLEKHRFPSGILCDDD